MIKAADADAAVLSPCVDSVETFLAAAARIEPTLRAFTQIDAERLRAEAAALDALPVAARGPLHGMLIAVKEVYDVAGYTCGWGSPIHADRIPTVNADAVDRLLAAGALVAGITVSTEYAIAMAGPTVNPHDPERTPGASSQGSSAAVGAGLVPAALGSQTIGSTIRPAAYCGCVGFKPTWGAIDDARSMPLSGPLDHPGIIAADPATATALFAVLATDPPMAKAEKPGDVVIIRPWYGETPMVAIEDAIRRAAGKLRLLGAPPEIIDVPDWIAATEANILDTILAYGMAANHGCDFDRATGQMSPRVRDYISRGRVISVAQYVDAMAEKERIADTMDALIGSAVAITAPTLDIAPLLAEGTGSRDPQRLWTLTGQPAGTVPMGTLNGLPLGVQVVAGRNADSHVLATLEILFEKN